MISKKAHLSLQPLWRFTTLAVPLIAIGCSQNGSSKEVEKFEKRLQLIEKSLNDLQSSLQPTERLAADRTTDERAFQQALEAAEKSLEKNAFAEAYDLILCASRLRPSDPKLFELVMNFVERAAKRNDDDAHTFADDLFTRSEALIHYQPVDKVLNARRRYQDLTKKLARPAQPPLNPFKETEHLLSMAEAAVLPVPVRTKACEQARNALNDLSVSLSAPAPGSSQGDATKRISELEKRIDAAEQSCVVLLFQRAKAQSIKWLEDTKKLLDECQSVEEEKVPEASERLKRAIAEGFEDEQEIAPYSKAKVLGASDLVGQLEERVALLERMKTWVYNQQILRLIRYIETKNEWQPAEKLKHLAEVNEARLSPYVFRRFNEVWDKIFEKLPNEDEKLEAVKLRILRTKE
jgi:hypothetical protein